MSSSFLVFFVLLSISTRIAKAQGGNDWLCESLICDPPKKCVLVDEVAQCLVDTNPTPTPFGTINGGQPLFPQQPFPSNPSPPSPPSPSPSPFSFQTAPPTLIPDSPPPTIATTPTPTTPPNPLAPFLNFFNPPGGMTPATLLPPFTLPTLPTLPTTAPPTTQPPIDICTLPPITGSCSRARIMWYYDTETRRCERFSWSGCGNENRFSSKMQCEQTCSQTSLFRRNQ